jgi:uncharacterized protein involved in type VI secretion and phage assembly
MSYEEPERFFGKYRGTVTDNKDPQKIGRIQANVPAIFGDHNSGWALPCTPYAGADVGLFCIPPIGAMVWIEFESGNPEKPIWTGGFWNENETPDNSADPEIKYLKTDTTTIILNDKEKSITLDTSDVKIIINKDGIELSNSSQKIKIGASSVSINDGALEIT